MNLSAHSNLFKIDAGVPGTDRLAPPEGNASMPPLTATEDSQGSLSNEFHDAGLEADYEDSVDFSLPLKQVLFAMNNSVCQRLDEMESRLDSLNHYCIALEQKIDSISTALQFHDAAQILGDGKQIVPTVIVGVPQSQSVSSDDEQGAGAALHLSSGSSNMQLLTLNSEADYPDGSWLGDVANPEMRVRCHISPQDLFHVNTTCHSAEKMALTLLDYLFDRETQAVSNISGTGKHKKKQLDPLMIYGIRCHLLYKFGIVEKDWHRIRQNLDSKCRTAYRRKVKGMPLLVKAFGEKAAAGLKISTVHSLPSDSKQDLGMDHSSNESDDMDPSQVLTLPSSFSLGGSNDFVSMVNGTQLIHTAEGDIQVLHATPEQLAEIQQLHQIQICGINTPVTVENLANAEPNNSESQIKTT